MYYVLSLIPVIFDYLCVFLSQSSISAFHLIEFVADWFFFTIFLIWINCIYILSRRSSAFGSVMMSLFVCILRYGAVYMVYYAAKEVALDAFGLKALFLTNFYIFLPFAASVIMFILYKIFFKKKKKRKK